MAFFPFVFTSDLNFLVKSHFVHNWQFERQAANTNVNIIGDCFSS